MTRAVLIERPGGPEVLSVGERDVRAAGPGELRIAVRAAAVNPTDIGLRQHGDPDREPPWTPGMDAAGVVESVGRDVEGITAGDQVMAALTPRRPEGGAQAELIVVPAASVVPIPEGASLEQASTLPMNGLTAMLGLQMLGLASGDTLVVTGGAGLLASYVIPLARERGLRVLGDANQSDEELVRGFGADEVLPRGEGFLDAIRALAPQGVDGVYDTALLGREVLGALRDGGGMAVVRGWEGPDPERSIRIHKVFVRTVLERTDWLQELRRMAAEGRIALRVAGEYPPQDAAQAHRVMDAGGLRGRAVIVF
jgi:NADPH:quinone reductase-like Zn-dependent oxidoreductase